MGRISVVTELRPVRYMEYRVYSIGFITPPAPA